MPRLTDYGVLTFDCYGTLIDWETGIWDALQPLIMENDDAGVTRAAALGAFAKCESRQEQATPGLRYPELLSRVHRRIAETFGMQTDVPLDEAFGASVPHWPAFPDTADALRALQRHYKLVILSNVHRDGIAASNRKLGVDFDAIYTAEGIGSYKARGRQLRVSPRPSEVRPRVGAVRRAAYGAESAPRPRPREPLRARQRLDRPAAAVRGRELGCDRTSGSDAVDRLRVLLDGRDGGCGRCGTQVIDDWRTRVRRHDR